ncbi:MAG: matrixin family metalloprotease [Gemmatimonadaceae bacterium]
MVLAALVTALAVFIVVNARAGRARAQHREQVALARDTTVVAAGLVQGTVRRELIPTGKGQSTSPEEMRRRVRNLATGTYVNDILSEQDSALYRWPERLSEALRVYIEPASAIPGFDARYPEMGRTVFAEWSEAGFPLRFTFIYDSTSADITIRWIDRFASGEGQRIGVTERIQTSQFQIAKAYIAIANHDSTGRALTVATVGGIIRHEIGHALGLNHANDPTSVMYRESATSTIGNSDRATLRLLYLMPGGSLKD